MNKTENPNQGPAGRTRFLSPWLASPLALIMWEVLPWTIFYGSGAVLMAFVVWFLFFNDYAMPQEERVLEAHFGEAYREYRNKVPRWFGKIKH